MDGSASMGALSDSLQVSLSGPYAPRRLLAWRNAGITTPTIDDGWVYAQGATGKLVALDGATGELRWQRDLLAEYGVTPEQESAALPYGRSGSPLVVGDLVVDAGGAFEVEEIWHANRVMRTKFTNAAILDGYVYGLSDGILESIDLATGERRWKGGRYRQGQILRVGDLLLVVAESGEVSLVEATPERRNHVLGSFQAVAGKTWNNPALYGPYLLVRNAEEAACYKLPLA